MEFNSSFTNILVEFGIAIVLGVLMEIFIETLSVLLAIPFFVFYFFLSAFTGGSAVNNWPLFIIMYTPFVLLKLVASLLLWLFFVTVNYSLLKIILIGIIGFYTLVYDTLYEVLYYWKIYHYERIRYSQIKAFFRSLPIMPFHKITIWIGFRPEPVSVLDNL